MTWSLKKPCPIKLMQPPRYTIMLWKGYWAMQWVSVTHEQPSTTSYTEIYQISLFCNRYIV